MKRGDETSKSVGPSRKSSLSKQRLSVCAPPLPLLLESISKASEKEKLSQYDLYRTTGDFERDFTLLCRLKNLNLPITRRRKVPSSLDSPISPNKEAENTPIPEESLKNHERRESLPKTYLVANNKYEYFKPRVEIETDFEANKEYIKGLYLRGWKVDERIINVILKTALDLEGLTILNMWNAGLVDETVLCLGQCLSFIPSLDTLLLDGNNHVINQNFYVFVEDIGQLKLKHLSLRNCNLNESGAWKLSSRLSENKNLLTLNLSFNKLGDKGACHIANSLRLNRSLLSLDMSSNGIGNTGVKHIADSISTFALTHEEIVKKRETASNAELDVISPLRDRVFSERHPTGKKRYKEVPTKKKDIKGKDKIAKIIPHKKVSTSKMENIFNPVNLGYDEDTLKHPLFEKTSLINGELWIPGNRSLINLNLSRNKITRVGLESLYTAIRYQNELTQQITRTTWTGLMRLSLQKNSFPLSDVTYIEILGLLEQRTPLVTIQVSLSEKRS